MPSAMTGGGGPSGRPKTASKAARVVAPSGGASEGLAVGGPAVGGPVVGGAAAGRPVVGGREQRVEELVQPGVRQAALRLDPGGADDQLPVLGREPRRQVEQGALADAGLAPEDQGLSVGGQDEHGQPRPFAVPTDHHHARFQARFPPLPRRRATATVFNWTVS